MSIPITHRFQKPGEGRTGGAYDQGLRFVISSLQDGEVRAIIAVCQGPADGIETGAGACSGKPVAVWELQITIMCENRTNQMIKLCQPYLYTHHSFWKPEVNRLASWNAVDPRRAPRSVHKLFGCVI